MSYYKDVILKDIKNKRDRKERGLFNGIKIPFRRYDESFSFIEPGMYYQVLGETGIGKSTFVRSTFVYEALKFSWANNYPVRIIYFALEDGKMLVYKKFVKHYLHERYGIILPQKYIESKDMPLAQKYLDMLEADCDFYEQFEKSVHIINDATSPSHIYAYCLKFHEKFGDSCHLIAIIDNFSNITKDEHHKTEWEAVRELSRNKIRLELCKNYNFTVVGVLQQDFESVKNAARNVGKAGIAAIEPNMSSIGDAKVVAKDAFVILAIFNPNRYDIKMYPYAEGYNIDILRDRFRSVLMLKNNSESMTARLPLYFDGATENFTELPNLEDKEALEKIYNKVIQEEKDKRERFMLGQKKLWS